METRVHRYSKKSKLKRNIKILLRRVVRNISFLIVGMFSAIYFFLRAFNNLIAKWFMKLPRLMKVALIYLLVLNVFLDVYDAFKFETKEINISLDDIIAENVPINFDEAEEKECLFDSTSCKIAEKGKEIGLNEEQILMSIAISKWETGNYTSDAFLNKNNVGGMMCNSGLISYSTLDDGIIAFVSNLKYNYFDIGLISLELIQPKYCPIGAKNDPNNLNQYWLDGTTKMYNELVGK